MTKYVNNEEVMAKAEQIADMLVKVSSWKDPHDIKLYGIPRGGIPAAYAVTSFLPNSRIVDEPGIADVLVDDIIGTGRTKESREKLYPDKIFVSLFEGKQEEWLIFPWELNMAGSADDIPRRLIQFIGEDCEREGLKDTPDRFLRAWEFWTSGYKTNDQHLLKSFVDGSENYDELVFVGNIPFYSHCEHHLAPFFGYAHIGYIPNQKIVGLSKLSRVVDMFARRLQVQERLTTEIAKLLDKFLLPKGLGVVLMARHLCMESRGVSKPRTITTTSSMKGCFKKEASARSELLQFISNLKTENI